MRGPNFGVGGGLASIADGLLTGLGLQLEQRLPGTWVIFSEWEVEPGQEAGGATPRARALALALGPRKPDPSTPHLRLRPASASSLAPAHPRLAGLTDFLRDPSKPWSCTFDWGMELLLSAGESKA